MAEIKSNPVIYNCDVEGRDAFWSALRNSFNRKAITLTKKPCPEQVFCDSSQYEYQCSDVENKLKNNSEEPFTGSPPLTPETPDKTAEDQSNYSTATPTTPSPPPPLQSPPPLEHRSAGQRRRSAAYADGWPTEPRSAVFRLKSRASAISAITWLDDFATTATCLDGDRRPCENCANNGDSDDGRPTAVDEEDGRGAGDEDADSPRRSAEQRPIVAVDDGDKLRAEITPLPSESPARSTDVVVMDDDDDDDDDADVDDDDDADVDEPTLVDDDNRDQRHCNDPGVNHLYSDVVGDSPATVFDNKSLSKYEMKVKEIDENIAFYSKRFLCTVMFLVLLRVFY